MSIALVRVRLGVVVKGALLASVGLAAALGCGKKAENGPDPGPRAAATESEKTEKTGTKGPEKKVIPGLTDLTAPDGQKDTGWDVQADPGPAISGPFSKDAIPFVGEVVVPMTTSPFVAIGVPKANNTYLVYNL